MLDVSANLVPPLIPQHSVLPAHNTITVSHLVQPMRGPDVLIVEVCLPFRALVSMLFFYFILNVCL